MSRKACCVGEGLKKGTWTADEDKKLVSYIQEHGEGNWRDMPQKAGIKRCGKSCRLRWTNYLKPDIKRGEFSEDEEQIIIMLHASRGNKWSVIASHLPKRTDNEIKNHWNTHLKKRLISQGIDPVTHKPLSPSPNPGTPKIYEFEGDDSNPSNPDEHSQSGPMSLKSLTPSSSSCNLLEISSSDETPKNDGFLSSKKCCFKRTNSRSKLLNKVASRASSIGNILVATMERNLMSSTTLPNDEFSENTHFQMDQFDPFYQSEDIGMNTDLNIAQYNFSHFLEQFSNIGGEEDDNIGGYNQDLIVSDVSSTKVDEDKMMQDITGWSTYLVDQSDFTYYTDQYCDEKDFI